MKSQTEQILNYLQKGKKLTALEALNKFNCFRLAARISDLRRDGHYILTDTIVNGNKSYASYKLSKPKMKA